ncbi:MAG: molybdopterin-dependent oxidoreductase, partial [Desulfuromonadales bacterium]|nr:molybdopterin-dependent oxidoreductase [Desulfuromonadales bacterium]
MVSLKIDGKEISVSPESTILEAANQLGIQIPTLCWLQKVSPTGACRICAVEVEGVDRPMTACNTLVKEGINVTTQSEKLAQIRYKIMELLLVNHPLDCPVCDAGGECDLQDSCHALGIEKHDYRADPKRIKIRYDWKLLESDPNRCILCEKCVKVDHEIVGCNAIRVVNKGEDAIIDTIDGEPLDCEFCGNCIAACPTGTLISKPFKFKGRPWVFDITKSVCGFCSSGCQIEYHSADGIVERVTSDDSGFNEGNLCISGRFGYSMFNSDKRLTTPLLNQQPTTWDNAINTAVDKLKEIGAERVAAIASPRLTNEENFLFAKLIKGAIGSPNIDSEARFGFAPAICQIKNQLGFIGSSGTIDKIDNADAVLVLGSDAESTGVDYRVIKAAVKNDAALVVANMRSVKLVKFANTHLQYKPGGEVALLNGLAKALIEKGCSSEAEGFEGFKASLEAVSIGELASKAGVAEACLREAAALLAGKKNPAVILGGDIMRSVNASDAVTGVLNIALLLGAIGKDAGGLFPVDEKNNTLGMLEMGAVPGENGKDLWGIIEGIEKGSIKALYIADSNPVGSFPDSNRIRNALEKLDLLIVQDINSTETTKLAHIVFPGAAASEKNGTFTTPDGRVQAVQQAVLPPGSARTDIEIFADLYKALGKRGESETLESVTSEIEKTNPCYGSGPGSNDSIKPKFISVTAKEASSEGLKLLVGPILYHNGTSTLNSENNLVVAPDGYIMINPDDAQTFGISKDMPVTVSGG